MTCSYELVRPTPEQIGRLRRWAEALQRGRYPLAPYKYLRCVAGKHISYSVYGVLCEMFRTAPRPPIARSAERPPHRLVTGEWRETVDRDRVRLYMFALGDHEYAMLAPFEVLGWAGIERFTELDEAIELEIRRNLSFERCGALITDWLVLNGWI